MNYSAKRFVVSTPIPMNNNCCACKHPPFPPQFQPPLYDCHLQHTQLLPCYHPTVVYHGHNAALKQHNQFLQARPPLHPQFPPVPMYPADHFHPQVMMHQPYYPVCPLPHRVTRPHLVQPWPRAPTFPSTISPVVVSPPIRVPPPSFISAGLKPPSQLTSSSCINKNKLSNELVEDSGPHCIEYLPHPAVSPPIRVPPPSYAPAEPIPQPEPLSQLTSPSCIKLGNELVENSGPHYIECLPHPNPSHTDFPNVPSPPGALVIADDELDEKFEEEIEKGLDSLCDDDDDDDGKLGGEFDKEVKKIIFEDEKFEEEIEKGLDSLCDDDDDDDDGKLGGEYKEVKKIIFDNHSIATASDNIHVGDNLVGDNLVGKCTLQGGPPPSDNIVDVCIPDRPPSSVNTDIIPQEQMEDFITAYDYDQVLSINVLSSSDEVEGKDDSMLNIEDGEETVTVIHLKDEIGNSSDIMEIEVDIDGPFPVTERIPNEIPPLKIVPMQTLMKGFDQDSGQPTLTTSTEYISSVPLTATIGEYSGSIADKHEYHLNNVEEAADESLIVSIPIETWRKHTTSDGSSSPNKDDEEALLTLEKIFEKSSLLSKTDVSLIKQFLQGEQVNVRRSFLRYALSRVGSGECYASLELDLENGQWRGVMINVSETNKAICFNNEVRLI